MGQDVIIIAVRLLFLFYFFSRNAVLVLLILLVGLNWVRLHLVNLSHGLRAHGEQWSVRLITTIVGEFSTMSKLICL